MALQTLHFLSRDVPLQQIAVETLVDAAGTLETRLRLRVFTHLLYTSAGSCPWTVYELNDRSSNSSQS